MEQTNHRKEIDKNIRMFTEEIIPHTWKIDETLEGVAALAAHHIRKFRG